MLAPQPPIGAAVEDFLTQTQNVAASQLIRPTVDSDVVARLVLLTESGVSYEVRRDQKEVDIGRHPDCKIVVKDKRASSRHLRIYRDEHFHFFIEELSANGAWCNDHHMIKGDTRALQHGDAISICVHHSGKTPGQKPFAAYIFRLTDHQSDPTIAGDSSSMAAPAIPRTATSDVATQRPTNNVELDEAASRLVNEQWVNDNWDMRTVLGSGNFSEVRLGVQVKKPGSEKCAVKVIDKKRFVQFQSKRESQLSLQSEAAILMGLDNPGIIRFFEWFETEEKLFIAMEFLSGGDLLQYILEHGCFSENVARRLFSEIAGAVKYLHEKNIVHRDLKPENILLTSKSVDDMRPKLADFGLARMNMKTKDCKTFCGTPHYFAPEVIHTFRDRDAGQPGGYGKQADMWSLGVILYIMLSGIPPFEEDGLYEQILEGKYEFDVHEWNQVSPEAKELVRQLMTVNPKGRLTIQQTLAHKWFTIGQAPTPPDHQALVAKARPAPLLGDEGASTKRRRTIGDGDGEATAMSVDTVLAPLGA
mmetsp:Transcript_94293/g.236695  ORF Transcript_94293/g.236695 Transcript_94293/m.236695 type:complete len:532 (+) Transcript_94293:77-1672(+)